jgi:hypothetical protein
MLVSCSNGNLRGREVDSLDGKTYLVIEDDNGGQCGPILIDGQVWEYPINKIGKIKPGIHTIECGGEIEFEIKEGTTFHFDYWGP